MPESNVIFSLSERVHSMKQIKNNSFISGTDFQNATGTIPYNMTNDYMFRAVLQKNNKVLKGLICSLLHLKEHEVVSVTITNPIILGDALEDKEFRLDINVLLNNYRIYSDNLVLRVVDLTQINLATSEDKAYLIDYWAALFKAKTWEEIKMLAEKNEYLNEASETMFQLSADELIKKRCRDREEYYQDLRNYERVIAAKDSQITELTSEVERLRAELDTLKKHQ